MGTAIGGGRARGSAAVESSSVSAALEGAVALLQDRPRSPKVSDSSLLPRFLPRCEKACFIVA